MQANLLKGPIRCKVMMQILKNTFRTETHEGGVHICKLAYGDLTWENLSSPKTYALWYTMITGHYTQYST